MPHPQLCHHICHIIIHSMPCHHYLCLSLSFSYHHILGYSLRHYWTPPATINIGYSVVIRELLWHQWQLYSQQYPPLALMETSKHFPPLTTMTKDNLYCCTNFDIGFHVFFFLTMPHVIISPLFCLDLVITNVLSFILIFPFLQHVFEW